MRMYHQPCNACISYGLEYDRYAQPFAHRTTECRAVVTDLPSSGVCALNPGGVCCMYCLVVVRGLVRAGGCVSSELATTPRRFTERYGIEGQKKKRK